MNSEVVFNSLENILKSLMPKKNWVVKRDEKNIEIYEKYKQIDNFSINMDNNNFKIIVPAHWTNEVSYVSYFNKNRDVEDLINYLFRQAYSYYKVKFV